MDWRNASSVASSGSCTLCEGEGRIIWYIAIGTELGELSGFVSSPFCFCPEPVDPCCCSARFDDPGAHVQEGSVARIVRMPIYYAETFAVVPWQSGRPPKVLSHLAISSGHGGRLVKEGSRLVETAASSHKSLSSSSPGLDVSTPVCSWLPAG